MIPDPHEELDVGPEQLAALRKIDDSKWFEAKRVVDVGTGWGSTHRVTMHFNYFGRPSLGQQLHLDVRHLGLQTEEDPNYGMNMDFTGGLYNLCISLGEDVGLRLLVHGAENPYQIED
jgi:hypothetical protein